MEKKNYIKSINKKIAHKLISNIFSIYRHTHTYKPDISRPSSKTGNEEFKIAKDNPFLRVLFSRAFLISPTFEINAN